MVESQAANNEFHALTLQVFRETWVVFCHLNYQAVAPAPRYWCSRVLVYWRPSSLPSPGDGTRGEIVMLPLYDCSQRMYWYLHIIFSKTESDLPSVLSGQVSVLWTWWRAHARGRTWGAAPTRWPRWCIGLNSTICKPWQDIWLGGTLIML